MFLAWHGSKCALAPSGCFSASHTGRYGQFPTTLGPARVRCLVCEPVLHLASAKDGYLAIYGSHRPHLWRRFNRLDPSDRFSTKDGVRACCRSRDIDSLRLRTRIILIVCACALEFQCAGANYQYNSSAQAQTINISRSTARADPIFGAESIARIQAIESAPKMRSVRSVDREISIFCTRQVQHRFTHQATDPCGPQSGRKLPISACMRCREASRRCECTLASMPSQKHDRFAFRTGELVPARKNIFSL